MGWHITSAIVGFAISVALILLDPFDLDRGVSERGRDAFYEIAAYAYPEAQSPKTLVVLLDDVFLESNQRTWPVSAATHAGAIETIARHQPQAIVIDFMFVDQRDDDSLQFLIRTLERVVEDPIRIYIAAPPRNILGRYARPEIEDLVEREERIEFVSVGAGRDVGAGLTYPMTAGPDEPRPAAVALYEDLCNRPGNCRLPRSGAEMDLWWAVPRRDTFNCGGAAAETCERIPPGPISRTFSVLLGVFGALLPERWKPLNPAPIPYSPTVGLADYLSGAHDDLIGQRAHGGVVFYGSNIAFGSDYEDTPTQGLMPGVQAHAMAYDNLVALNGRYIQARAPFGWGPKQHLILLIALLFAASAAARIALMFIDKRSIARPHRNHRYFGVSDSVVFIGVSLLVVTLEFSVGRIGPYAWAPVLAVVAAGDLLSNRAATGAAFLFFRSVWPRFSPRPPVKAAAGAPAPASPPEGV